MPHRRRWIIKHADFATRDRIVKDTGISPFIASVLVNRDVCDPEEVLRFLSPSLLHLHDPLLMKDMDKAVDCLQKAILNRVKVIVYGDYDVDGIVSSTLMRDFLHFVGLDCEVFIPNRLKEGYGLNNDVVEEFAAKGFKLLITVDCGVRGVEAIAKARELGMDVLVTDHHEAGDELPPANAIIDPVQPGCEYPFKKLAGVGVAFKLVWALSRQLSGGGKVPAKFSDFLKDALPLVAMGTICDVVPLLGENRAIVSYGLRNFFSSKNLGLKSLLEVSGVMGRIKRSKREITVRDIAFMLGPRVNAAGRMGKSDTALELFSTTDPDRAVFLAQELEKLNKERRELEADITKQAREMVLACDSVPEAIVLQHPDWHHGVLGIVASRLVTEFCRPAYLGRLEDGIVRGSARSIPDYNINAALTENSKLLDRFGGHSGAAGFAVKLENFEALAKGLVQSAKRSFEQNPKLLSPVVNIEAELPFTAINEEFVSQLEQLEPFGHGHPRPVFLATGVEVVGEPRLVGTNNMHLVCHFKKDGIAFRSIGFNLGPRISALSGKLNILFAPKFEKYNGYESLQLEVLSLKGMEE